VLYLPFEIEKEVFSMWDLSSAFFPLLFSILCSLLELPNSLACFKLFPHPPLALAIFLLFCCFKWVHNNSEKLGLQIRSLSGLCGSDMWMGSEHQYFSGFPSIWCAVMVEN
jgi:hypothetical protein